MSVLISILSYFFSPLPLENFKFKWFFAIVAILGILVSIALKIVLKKKKEDKALKKLFRDLPRKLLTVSILEAIYVGARYENMPYLSMRFINYIILASGIYVIVKYILKYFREYPIAKKEYAHQMEQNKYLPRKWKKH